MLSSPLTNAELDKLTDVQPTLTDNTNDEVTTVRGDTTGLRSGASDVQNEKNLTPAAATDTSKVGDNPPGTGVRLESDDGKSNKDANSLAPNNLTGLGGSTQTQPSNYVMGYPKSGTSVPADVPPKETEVVTDAEFDAAFTPAPIASEQVQPYNFPETTGTSDKPKSKKNAKVINKKKKP